jgi:hypothetical protein
MVCFTAVYGQQTAFPGAEGYGRFTTGGRGGAVIEVTNLSDAGSGSLRAAVESQGKRTVVFRVSGTIVLTKTLQIKNGDITIAGQTAPGDGICVRNFPFIIDADNVIIRYIRSRLGDEDQNESDCVWARNRKNLIIDHCSFSWSVDETASFYDNANFTMQWCFITESLYHSVHAKGDHGYGGIWGGLKATFHHNLLAHHSSRNPRFCGSRYHGNPAAEIVDHRNNVIFNWGGNSCHGGEAGNQNVIANYYRSGPATNGEKKYRIAEPWDGAAKWYVAQNFVHGYPDVSQDNWKGGVQGSYASQVRTDTPIPAAWVVTHTAENTFEQVLLDGGASLSRDSVDIRITGEVRTGKPTYGGIYGAGKGIIDSQKDVGGWPVLKSLPAPADDDHDGMPNGWETAMGFSPSDPTDRNGDHDGDGYTNLEEYLNGLCVRPDFVLAPAGLRVEGLSPTEIRLTWQEDSQNETGFLVERSGSLSGGYVEAGSTGPNDTTFTDNGLKAGMKTYYRVRATNGIVQSLYTNVDSAFSEASTHLRAKEDPSGFALGVEGYPNPFNPKAMLEYTMPKHGRVRLIVLNLLGMELTRLMDEEKEQGRHRVELDGSAMTSGIVVVRLECGRDVRTRKMVLMK